MGGGKARSQASVGDEGLELFTGGRETRFLVVDGFFEDSSCLGVFGSVEGFGLVEGRGFLKGAALVDPLFLRLLSCDFVIFQLVEGQSTEILSERYLWW